MLSIAPTRRFHLHHVFALFLGDNCVVHVGCGLLERISLFSSITKTEKVCPLVVFAPSQHKTAPVQTLGLSSTRLLPTISFNHVSLASNEIGKVH